MILGYYLWYFDHFIGTRKKIGPLLSATHSWYQPQDNSSGVFQCPIALPYHLDMSQNFPGSLSRDLKCPLKPVPYKSDCVYWIIPPLSAISCPSYPFENRESTLLPVIFLNQHQLLEVPCCCVKQGQNGLINCHPENELSNNDALTSLRHCGYVKGKKWKI